MGDFRTPNTPFLGNTKEMASCKKREKEVKKFCFTWNNYIDDLTDFNNTLNTLGKYIYGFEVGESGTPHLQGYINLNGKKTFNSLKNHINIPGLHIEACKGSEQDNINYCSKQGKVVSNFIKVKPQIKVVSTLRPFQESLKNLLTGPVDEGAIHWVIDFKGQLGKTDFLRYMYVNHNVPFAYGGKCADLMNLVYNNKNYFLDNEYAAMIFNLGRDTDMEKVSYKSLEQISDGAIFNSKFECGCFVCNKPHVLVLANNKPLLHKMTLSRWRLYTINDNYELVDYVEDESDVDSTI